MATVVVQQATEVIQSWDDGLIVKSRILQAWDVNLTAVSVNLDTVYIYKINMGKTLHRPWWNDVFLTKSIGSSPCQ